MARVADPAKREAWRRRLAAFDRGQASVADFCRRTGISVASFYQWRRKLAPGTEPLDSRPSEVGRTWGEARSRGGQAARPHRQAPALTFMPVEITGGASIEVHLPSGARLLVPCQDRRAIRAVIGALVRERKEDRPC